MDIKKIKKISVFLSIYIACCMFADFFLSLNYFLNVDRARFVMCEVCTELSSFFVTGEIPLFMILHFVSCSLAVGIMSFFLLKWTEEEKKESKQFQEIILCAQCFFLSGFIFVGLVRISGGLTWYYHSSAHVISDRFLFIALFLPICSICIFTWLEIKKSLIKRRAKMQYLNMQDH